MLRFELRKAVLETAVITISLRPYTPYYTLEDYCYQLLDRKRKLFEETGSLFNNLKIGVELVGIT